VSLKIITVCEISYVFFFLVRFEGLSPPTHLPVISCSLSSHYQILFQCLPPLLSSPLAKLVLNFQVPSKSYIKRRFKQIVNNSTDINRKNNLISPQTTEHRKNLHRRPWKSRSWIGTYRKLWRGLNRLMGTTSLLSL
jgi:hypothetical protein